METTSPNEVDIAVAMTAITTADGWEAELPVIVGEAAMILSTQAGFLVGPVYAVPVNRERGARPWAWARRQRPDSPLWAMVDGDPTLGIVICYASVDPERRFIAPHPWEAEDA